MYQLFVQFKNQETFKKDLTEKQVRAILASGFRELISWATITTPSGVSRDVTSKLQEI